MSSLTPRRGIQRRNGFTLIEVMVVVAIIGILTAIALPYYGEYVTRSRFAEAYGALADMRFKMELAFQDNPSAGYTNGCNDPTIAAYVAGTGVRNFTYQCTAPTSTTFTVTATGAATQNMAGFTFTLNEANQQATTSTPAGWASNANCWIRRKDGSC